MPQGEIGDDENMIIFDDVFVPWDRVFICGENKYATLAAYLFARYSTGTATPAATLQRRM